MIVLASDRVAAPSFDLTCTDCRHVWAVATAILTPQFRPVCPNCEKVAVQDITLTKLRKWVLADRAKRLRGFEYAPHAKLRMSQRVVSRKEITKTLLAPDEDVEGDRPGRRVAVKRFKNGRELVVVYTARRKPAVIITTYWRKPWK